MKNCLKVVVRGKRGKLFEGDCESLSLKNELGDIDILPDHTNFVSVIFGEIVARESSGKVWRKDCEKALLRVTKNVVDLLVFD